MKRKFESSGSPDTRASRSMRWLALTAMFAVAVTTVALLEIRATGAESDNVVVYKTPTCGCCGRWVTHLRDSGFEVDVVNVSSTQPVRERLGVPGRLASCHTARIGDYWVEGHVPADLIRRLLAEHRGDIRGITVPGMPMGSPGMEGSNPVTYDILAYDNYGQTTVFATRTGRQPPP